MLRLATEDDLTMMLSWRNHPSVRRVMLTEHEISLEEHLAWWKKQTQDQTKQVLIMEHQGMGVAVVNFFDIDFEARSCHWGFYMNPADAIDRDLRLSVWLNIEQAAIDYAFHNLGMSTLLCETLKENQHVLELHQRFGFYTTREYTQKRKSDTVSVVEMSLSNTRLVEDLSSDELSICFMGSANWDIASRIFVEDFSTITTRVIMPIDIPFGQYKAYLHNSSSLLYKSQPDVCVFCERFEELVPSSDQNSDYEALRFQLMQNYIDDIRLARQKLTGHIIIFDLFPIDFISDTAEDPIWTENSSFALASHMNQQLATLCEEIEDCHLLPLSSLVLRYGQSMASPGKYWYLGRIPYSHEFHHALSTLLTKSILTLQEKTARAIIVDLDNTLWHGVIGDDGVENIVLGGDFPGNIYSDIQRILKRLHAQGIMLAICSKNTESVALDAIKQHPNMILKSEDFCAWRINWQSKADNILELAAELSLGLDSIMFLDDSPYERAAVRACLPSLIVPELPDELSAWPDFLLNLPQLAAKNQAVTGVERGTSLALRNKEKSKQYQFSTQTEFWASFESKLEFVNMDRFNKRRIHQLVMKTNQFNTNSHRFSMLELSQLVDNGYQIYAIQIGDRFAAAETAGVVIVAPMNTNCYVIDNLILSCRYLGRGLEEAIYAWLGNQAHINNCTDLEIIFTPTERNEPAQNSLLQAGFDAHSGSYKLSINTPLVTQLPNWVIYIENSNEKRHLA